MKEREVDLGEHIEQLKNFLSQVSFIVYYIIEIFEKHDHYTVIKRNMIEKVKKLLEKKILSQQDWNDFKDYMISMVWAYPLNQYIKLMKED